MPKSRGAQDNTKLLKSQYDSLSYLAALSLILGDQMIISPGVCHGSFSFSSPFERSSSLLSCSGLHNNMHWLGFVVLLLSFCFSCQSVLCLKHLWSNCSNLTAEVRCDLSYPSLFHCPNRWHCSVHAASWAYTTHSRTCSSVRKSCARVGLNNLLLAKSEMP